MSTFRNCTKCGGYILPTSFKCVCQEFRITDPDGDVSTLFAKSAGAAAIKFATDHKLHDLVPGSVELGVYQLASDQAKTIKVSCEATLEYSASELP